MSTIRPEGASHTDSAGNYYKPDVFTGDWCFWHVETGKWGYVGPVPTASLRPLQVVQVVELEKFDVPAARRAVHTDAPMPSIAPAPVPAPAPAPVPALQPSDAHKWDHPGFPSSPSNPSAPFTNYFIKYQFVGSRITCNPPPLDTDQDVLVLVHLSNHAVMERKMFDAGFVKEGSLPADISSGATGGSVFHSYRKGDMNYIVTTDEAFYQRFSTATELARKYNLMEKSDRIQLFQAVLYGKWWA